MVDELYQLQTRADLCQLLIHYGDVCAADCQAWQGRVMEMPNLAPRELVQLHGQLLAYGWIEQNTGVVTANRPGTVAQCYRITPAGQKALKRLRGVRAIEEEDAEAA